MESVLCLFFTQDVGCVVCTCSNSRRFDYVLCLTSVYISTTINRRFVSSTRGDLGLMGVSIFGGQAQLSSAQLAIKLVLRLADGIPYPVWPGHDLNAAITGLGKKRAERRDRTWTLFWSGRTRTTLVYLSHFSSFAMGFEVPATLISLGILFSVARRLYSGSSTEIHFAPNPAVLPVRKNEESKETEYVSLRTLLETRCKSLFTEFRPLWWLSKWVFNFLSLPDLTR